ncbi:histidinol-phosphate aminotransferase family protein [Fulvivirga sp. M361]|uniref:pyridoxal phosphate-dependent aminotransferase n=1 Tax=Fulvivirga sp. M361 TaxID=2594266 RepID=UPI00117A866F|nr:histidinol-phosphate transaminase [Fulvivirga sp. M361]TRX62757.1 histidinol-phosphate aminotransferase family protein [Fulvivirga sp. M361]
MIYGHGDDIYRVEQELKANFSSNVWMEGPNEKLVETIANKVERIANYPEPDAEPLKQSLAIHHGLTPQHFMVCNGTAESIYLICQCFRDTSATIIVPTFSEYEDAARINGISCQFISLKEVKASLSFSTKLTFICNPNNPTGDLLPIEILDRWLSQNPKTIFVVDEAYYAFTEEAQSVLPLLQKHHNLVILRSLTKLFAIPGLRLGYIIASGPLIKKLQTFKIPWSVNALALDAGLYITEHYDRSTPQVDRLLKETEWLCRQVNRLTGYQCIPSCTTFFLVENQRGCAADLKAYLIRYHQLLIRNADNFRGLGDNVFRVATQTRSKNELLINALALWRS